MNSKPRYRWFVVSIFFVFMLLHQSDKLLIGPLTTPIMNEFHLSRGQMGFITTGALIVGSIFYPLWGYLYDRYARAKLLALAALIWGSTTWLSAIAPTYGSFMVTRATTGIDDSSYPGLFSLIADYFGPQVRGKIYGLLELTQPMGYLLGMILGLFLGGVVGWRGVFYLTGSLGVVLAAVILFGVREAPRGSTEPELEGIPNAGAYKFNWQTARNLFKIPTLRVLFIQGFFGVFPWNVITYWFFNYLETERNYSSNAVFVTMVIAVLVLAAGYPVGGAIGDYLFKRTLRGRLIISGIGVLLGAILLTLTLNVPLGNQGLFMLLLAVTALFIPFAAPNVISSVYDVTLPEVRSTALSVQNLIESSGAALAPGVAGVIADAFSLRTAFLLICVSAWILCAFFFTFAAYYAPRDIKRLRHELRERAAAGQILQAGQAPLDTRAGTSPASMH
jgi:MFS family permease